MKKFVFYLADSPNYPNEIFANSIYEAKSLILESIPDESQILKIIDVGAQQNQQVSGQLRNTQQQPVQEDLDPDNFNNASDFFTSVMNTAYTEEAKKKAAEKVEAEVEEEKKKDEIPIEVTSEPVKQIESVPPVVKAEEPPKFFEEAGIQFKLENGKLFKRSWINVSDDPEPQFRIKSKKTGKLADLEKFSLEKLEWIEIGSGS